jgi:hypothetical protein
MSRKLRSIDQRVRFGASLALPLCLLLSACGGGGTDVASIPPPPPTPTPTPPPAGTLDVQISLLPSPATRIARYGGFGSLLLNIPGNGEPPSPQLVGEGDVSFATDGRSEDGRFLYELDVALGTLPGTLTSLRMYGDAGTWTFNDTPETSHFEHDFGGDYVQVLGERLSASKKAADGSETPFLTYDFTRGTSSATLPLDAGHNVQATLDYDIGFSYVAMGEWSWRVVDLNGTAAGESGDLFFVDGNQTPTVAMPVSGTATYNARTLALLSSNGTPGIPFTLTADFGKSTISTQIDQDYQYNAADPAGDPILGIHLSGSTFFSNSNFDIPLAGTVNFSNTNVQVAPPAEPVTGAMNGAFFGPHAEQVGGVFAISRPDDTLLLRDAFVGQRP